jgi:hypothetical protein
VKALRLAGLVVLCQAALLACSSQAIDTPDDSSTMIDPTPVVEAVELVEVYTPHAKVPLSATSLGFNPTIAGELWVTLRQFASGKACTDDVSAGCDALRGVVAVVTDATGPTPSAVIKEDGNSWHFMRRPTALAWGEDTLFATCGEARTDNFEDEPTPYAGPVLWASDPEIFGVEPEPSQNGTHLDMLHETPYCMGLAHESANAFWAFNGDAGSLDRVDFHAPHPIGGEDHSDGEVHRYVTGELQRTPEVPSQVAYDPQRQLVYVADTGHGRVVRVDPSTATPGAEMPIFEPLQASGMMDGAAVTTLVAPGVLQMPSGLALAGNVLYALDNATGRIHTFDLEGVAQKVLDTGLPAGALGGVVEGPDAKLYLTDLLTGSVYRVELAGP